MKIRELIFFITTMFGGEMRMTWFDAVLSKYQLKTLIASPN